MGQTANGSHSRPSVCPRLEESRVLNQNPESVQSPCSCSPSLCGPGQHFLLPRCQIQGTCSLACAAQGCSRRESPSLSAICPLGHGSTNWSWRLSSARTRPAVGWGGPHPLHLLSRLPPLPRGPCAPAGRPGGASHRLPLASGPQPGNQHVTCALSRLLGGAKAGEELAVDWRVNRPRTGTAMFRAEQLQ